MDINAILMIIVFIIGYIFITLEHITNINKATVALMMAVLCWILQFTNPLWPIDANHDHLAHHLASISQVIFFLVGALTIVEIINVHKGFNIISDLIRPQSKRGLLWVIGILSFVLSAILDNLTTTVVMITLLNELMGEDKDKLLLGGAVVIAANAGGAWTPIGDVTTTMLWIGGQVSTVYLMKYLLLPSLACLVASHLFLTFTVDGEFTAKQRSETNKQEPMGNLIFFLGVLVLIFVPIFKLLTGLPPFMGMLFGLSIMWLVTDIIHYKYHTREHLRVPHVLTKIDLSGALFFLGILLCVDALDTAGILRQLANFLDSTIQNTNIIAIAIGLASAVVDNVPLVAATMGMYDLNNYPPDHNLWEMIAYCAGTGGSILLIGSAAGVVFMGMEKVDFLWYMKKITLPALIGYFAGIGIYLLIA